MINWECSKHDSRLWNGKLGEWVVARLTTDVSLKNDTGRRELQLLLPGIYTEQGEYPIEEAKRVADKCVKTWISKSGLRNQIND